MRRRSYLGYWEVKIEGKWRLEARYRYEQYHGIKLPSSAYVGFRDGDVDNLTKENLYLKNPELERAVQETGRLPKFDKPPRIKRDRSTKR